MATIDLNADCGESFGAWAMGADDALFDVITSANVACGFHAGDPLVMQRTVETLHARGIAIGAHPGFADLVGFGRREIAVESARLTADVLYQLGALDAMCRSVGASLAHVKPHGALYTMAMRDEHVARPIVDAVLAYDPDLLVYAQSNGALAAVARNAGLRVVAEAFADRAYTREGALAPRSMDGSVLHDPEEIASRILRMIEGDPIPTIDGGTVRVEAETICLHADTPGAAKIAVALRRALEAGGATVARP